MFGDKVPARFSQEHLVSEHQTRKTPSDKKINHKMCIGKRVGNRLKSTLSPNPPSSEASAAVYESTFDTASLLPRRKRNLTTKVGLTGGRYYEPDQFLQLIITTNYAQIFHPKMPARFLDVCDGPTNSLMRD